ncbi:DUF262 domain-containing protein, partial [Rodentibacter caecimuris]|uniref:DUF262 domain-containing protein n=1 Tax=Rodentibacter caecimuris TaxID=1796644 RepID=UPI00178CEEB7
MNKEDDKYINYLTLKELLDVQEGKYIIPIYQRNYAWGKGEIEQLIDDLYLASKEQGNKNYYIGSLIVYKRENGDYEVIDGQQRLTTLTILYSVLLALGVEDEFKNLGNNLSFEHREKSKNSLDRILNKSSSMNKKDSIEVAYEIINDRLITLKKEGKGDEHFEKFLSFLFGKVQILRTEVLPNTDLNHYFEIMNSRGEQLEKHEILKAHFMGKFETKNGSESPEIERKLFSMIWDACSDMDRCVVMGFPMEFRKKIFFSNLENRNEERESFCIKDFPELLNMFEKYLNNIS